MTEPRIYRWCHAEDDGPLWRHGRAHLIAHERGRITPHSNGERTDLELGAEWRLLVPKGRAFGWGWQVRWGTNGISRNEWSHTSQLGRLRDLLLGKRSHFRTEIEPGVPIPEPGKGENSWDCGDDAMHSLSVGGRSVEHAVTQAVGSVLRQRRRLRGPAHERGGTMTGKQWAELVNVEVISGTAQDAADKYRGFVTIRAVDKDGSIMMGQLDPETLRGMARQFFEVAEAAEQDAIVMTMLTRDFRLAPDTAGYFVSMMRKERGHE